jgi:hypothetical protein
MGTAAFGRCHASAADALSYYCAAAFPQTAGASVYSCTGVTGGALNFSVSTLTCSGSSCTTSTGTASVTPGLVACDQSDWLQYYPLGLSATDGALVASAITLVWMSAAGWRYLRSVLRGDDT